MHDTSQSERRVLLASLAVGTLAAIAASVYIGQREGIDIGLAVFVLSWTIVALFALVVRFLYLRLVGPTPSARALAPRSRRQRARKRRRNR